VKKKELLARIEELEARVAQLEAIRLSAPFPAHPAVPWRQQWQADSGFTVLPWRGENICASS
jgi:hypothetical protein